MRTTSRSTAQKDNDSPSANTPAAQPSTKPPEQRRYFRLDKAFPVRVESILFGDFHCIARNISAGGIFLETGDPLPLGARVRVSFLSSDESTELLLPGEVKNHYFMNYGVKGATRSVAGMAVRFLGLDEVNQQALRDCLNRMRVLH
jgi:hypothetical protein